MRIFGEAREQTLTIKSMPHTRSIGSDGEQIASDYLSRQGYSIHERNWQIRGGEIDIIAQE